MVSSTENLKARAVYIYLPSTKMAEDWKTRAGQQEQSISKFVIEHVLDSLQRERKEELGEMSGAVSRTDLIRQLRERDDELKKVAQDARLYRQLSEKLDAELRRYRIQPFLEPKFQGLRAYDKDLIELLRRKQIVDSDRILDELHVNPKQTELVKAIRSQLDNLEAYGLIKTTPRGWKWIG